MDALQPKGAYSELSQLLMARFISKDLRIPARRRSQSSLAGASRTKFRGRGMEFAEVRQYQPGDDVRSIDWRVTARTQTPFTKLYSEEREKPTFFLIDQRASMFFGSTLCFKSVFSAQLASTLGWTAAESGDRIGGMIAHQSGVEDIRPKGSQHAMLTLINRLHARNQALSSPVAGADEKSLSALLSDCRRALKPGSTLVIISDFADWNDECHKLVTLLARHNDLLFFHIYDRLEQQLPNNSQLGINNGRELVQLDPAKTQALAHCFQQRQASIEKSAQGLGVGYHLLECSTALTPWLQKHFGKLKRRG
ncbi:DUF58 domain-containing protein [Simiduia curdlanivorans]|uniref:DUF58 domain-containing protein n=1 Tax=Simiduia curdlanivorans TaxID=1492769 RepID=A0ABV8V891_9GAMM|nr:DUF58 domain-containing protein [Simiduia curdlanivorans]MDN3639542.1 DUF58 domain-containing protein [Simiduia curdlanivorans]